MAGAVIGQSLSSNTWRIALIAAVYFIAHHIAFLFPDSASVLMAVWPAAGIGLAALLLTPRRSWPSLLAAIFIAGIFSDHLVGRPLFMSLGFMTSNVLESLLCALLLQRWCKSPLDFSSLRTVLLLAFAATVVNGATACLGGATAALTGGGSFWIFWRTWWISDGLGIFLFTPFIIAWRETELAPARWRLKSLIAPALFLICWILVSWITFQPELARHIIACRPYFLVFLIGFAAVTLGMRTLTLALILLTAIAASSKSVALGPLFQGDTPQERLLELQQFIGAISLASFMLAAGISERRSLTKLLRRESAAHNRAQQVAHLGSWEWHIKPNRVIWSDEMYRIFGIAQEGFTGDLSNVIQSAIHPEDREKVNASNLSVIMEKKPVPLEYRVVRHDGSVRWVWAEAGELLCDMQGNPELLTGIVIDITERKRAELEREATIEFLRIENECGGISDLIYQSVDFFQRRTGCDAVGIRLKEGDDYPYYEARGFPPEFVATENSLCQRDPDGRLVRDSAGNPVIECMCGNVICGRSDPSKPFFTAHGSFWSNCTTDLLASTSHADRQARTRNRCNGEGYESVALLPLRVGDERLGLLQLNARAKGAFSPQSIALWERLADYLAIALSRFKAQEALGISEETHKTLFESMMDGFAFCRMIYADGKPEDFVYLNVNPAFEKLTGLKNVVGKKVSQVIPGVLETDKELIELYGRVAATGRAEVFEYYMKALAMWFQISVFSPKKDHFVAVFEIITERKTMEEALRREQERLGLAVSSGRLGIWDWNLETDAMIWNDRMFELYGITRDTFTNTIDAWTNGLHPEDKQRAIDECNTALAGKKDYDTTFRVLHPDGTVRHIKANALVTRNQDGKPIRMIGINTDLTEARSAEEKRIEFETQPSHIS